MSRRLDFLPKAHLHLHFIGAMRRGTLIELADAHQIGLPDAFGADWPPRLHGTDERGWFRFQRLYDSARAVLRSEYDLRRLITEIAQDEAAEGSGWLEFQVDPSGYAGRFGGLTPFTELVLDAAAQAARAAGVGIGVIIAANRTRHPLDARTVARLAARYVDRGVVGFGLSSDERHGVAADFAPAFKIAIRAGLISVPHGGELEGPASVRACVDELGADRIGHGVAAAADASLLDRLAERRITLEVCPASNVALGVAPTPADVPLGKLLDAGVQVALGADDPLLFGSRLTAQYELARRAHRMTDGGLAELARMSVRGSVAPADVKASLMKGIDAWLASPDPAAVVGARELLARGNHAPVPPLRRPQVPGSPAVPELAFWRHRDDVAAGTRRDGNAGTTLVAARARPAVQARPAVLARTPIEQTCALMPPARPTAPATARRWASRPAANPSDGPTMGLLRQGRFSAVAPGPPPPRPAAANPSDGTD